MPLRRRRHLRPDGEDRRRARGGWRFGDGAAILVVGGLLAGATYRILRAPIELFWASVLTILVVVPILVGGSSRRFERLHARTVAGETVPVPHAIGMHTVRRIERDPGGAIAYWVGTGDLEGYVRLPEGATRPPHFVAWSQVRLGRRWWHHVDD